jgi:hypothetical protein
LDDSALAMDKHDLMQAKLPATIHILKRIRATITAAAVKYISNITDPKTAVPCYFCVPE